MNEETLIAHYPRLFHMAHDGAWPSLEAHGLMSVEALVDQYGVKEPVRTQLLARHRPESVPIEADGLPGAVVRDQKPMSNSALNKCLQAGITPEQWYAYLNSYSFFWLHPNRVWRLINGDAYRGSHQTVLTIETASLVEKYRDTIRLSPINSGSTLFNPQPRSFETFMTIENFPFEQRKKGRPLENVVSELVVKHSVPDLKEHVLAVHRVKSGRPIEQIWASPRATADDHP